MGMTNSLPKSQGLPTGTCEDVEVLSILMCSQRYCKFPDLDQKVTIWAFPEN